MPTTRRTRVFFNILALQTVLGGSVMVYSGLTGHIESAGVPGALLLVIAACLLALGRRTADEGTTPSGSLKSGARQPTSLLPD